MSGVPTRQKAPAPRSSLLFGFLAASPLYALALAAIWVAWQGAEPLEPELDSAPGAAVRPIPSVAPTPAPAALFDVPLAGPGVQATTRYDELVRAAADRHHLPRELVQAVMHAESGFNRHAVSRTGAQGLMQLMPGTARQMRVDDPYDPADNIEGGSRYLRTLADKFQGDLVQVIAAYNAGPAAVQRYGGKVPPFTETQGYVEKVLKLYQRYQAHSNDTDALYWPTASARARREGEALRIALGGGQVSTASEGTVLEVNREKEGWTVRVTHDPRFVTVYAGLASAWVQEGATLRGGAAVGQAHSAGALFEVREQGESRDAMMYRWQRAPTLAISASR